MQNANIKMQNLTSRDRKGAGSFSSPKARHIVPAFTLTELLIALVILIIILGITGSVYKAASDAIGQNNATVSANTDVQATIQQIEQVIKGMYTDGYLVIYGLELNNNLVEQKPNGQTVFSSTNGKLPFVRSDAMCFFTTGNFRSMAVSFYSNAGWVYLGHTGTITPSSYGTSPFDPSGNPLVVNRWVVSKCLILLAPNGIGPDFRQYSIGELVKNASLMIANRTPLTTANTLAIRNDFYTAWIEDPNPSTVPTFHTPPIVDFTLASTTPFAYTLPNCGNFKIEFAMPKSYFNPAAPNCEPEQYLPSGDIVWRNALNDPTATLPNPNNISDTNAVAFNSAVPSVNAGGITAGSRTGDQIVVFGPNDVWPLLVRFTFRKYDENLTITSEEYFPGATPPTTIHGGTTFEYTYKLPAKR